MFKQRYKQANDRIHAPQGAYAQLGQHKKRARRFSAMQLVAACLALFVLATATVSLLDTSRQNGGMLATASARGIKDYNELYGYVSTAQTGGGYNGLFGRGVMDDLATTEESDGSLAAPNAAPQDAGEGGKSHSDTNVQVQGVDEADIIKTDGTYIYRLLDNEIAIIKADGADMEIVSRINMGKSDESPMASEFFITGDRLAVISNEYQWRSYGVGVDDVNEGVKTEDSIAAPGTDIDNSVISEVAPEPKTVSEPRDNAEPMTYVTVYDITDRTQPEKLDTLGQSGSYLTSRMVDGTVYLISSYYVYNEIMRDEPNTFTPSVTSNGKTTLIAPENIQVFEQPESPGYVVVTSVSMTDAKEHQSVKAVLGNAGTVYANAHSLLIAAGQYKADRSDVQKDENGKSVIVETYAQNTNLLLFKIDGGNITQKTSATIPGRLNDQFSMDEYDGVFRIVTTVNTSTTKIYTDGIDTYEYESYSANALYTLDQSLNVLGSIEDVAEGETVYSVRFDGDIGYFVTFRQVDPLFAVDLAEPKNPKVLSALKIPGFSDYLHVYDDGLLFGFGQNADEENGRVDGLKLSMFDVSDPVDVSEAHTKKLDANWSEASHNHKAILVDAERSLIAFAAEGYYYVYGYDMQDGFYQKAKLDIGTESWDGTLRGLFIEDCFYVCSFETIIAYSLNDFGKLASLKLN